MPKQDSFYTSPRALTTVAATENEGEVRKAAVALGETVNSTLIDYNRWDKLFPYVLILAEVGQDFTGTRKYNEIARFVLPIPPEQLQIQSPFAIATSKTLGGVLEEHNGIPFKIIFATGTTGVYPLRSNVVNNALAPFGLFGGTITAVQQTARTVANFVGTPSPVQQLTSTADVDLKGTGYGQFRLLKVFLENYANAKKNGERDMRLIFATFKDEIAYIVTPMVFNVRRDATQALKYRYELQLRSWGEVPSSMFSSFGEGSVEVSTLQSDFTRLLNKITTAQTVITSAVSVVNAFRGDVQAILNVSRQCALFLKLTVNGVVTVLDLPNKLLADCKASVVKSWNTIRDSISGQDGLLARLSLTTTNTLNAKVLSPAFVPTLPGQTAFNNIDVPPSVLDAIFANPSSEDAQQLLSQIKLGSLELPTALQTQIATELNRVRAFTSDDFELMRAQVLANMVSIGDTMGASDANYDSTYQNVHASTIRTPNGEDFDVLFAINDLLDTLNELSSNQPSPQFSTLDYIAGAATSSGIAFQVPVSKYAVPYPYDHTLEELANKYLGDPDRWLEIAALNGLREPYVDEIGFQVSLTANGKLSTVFIGDATNLRIGQPVWIQSDFIAREKRHILSIDTISPGNIILTLDGDADLAKYQISAHAYVQAFLPDTVNSQQLIYIPSQTVVPDNSKLTQIPGVDAFDDLLELGGIDLLLTTTNDLAITNDGDCKLAFGLQALIQRAKVALGTPQGSLIRHPNFGLPLKVGQSVADLDLKQLKSAVTNLFSDDPAFSGVINTSISQTGGVVQIGIGLQVAGQDLPISLTVQVKR